MLGWDWRGDGVPSGSGRSQKKVAQEIEVTAQDCSVLRWKQLVSTALFLGTVLPGCPS